MSNVSERSIHEVRADIEELLYRSARLSDEGRIDDWAALFTEDGTYKIVTRRDYDAGHEAALMARSGREEIRKTVHDLRQRNQLTAMSGVLTHDFHLVENVEVQSDKPLQYHVNSNYVMFQIVAEGSAGLDDKAHIFNVGRYVDEIIFDNGRPLIRSRLVIAYSGGIRNYPYTRVPI